MKIDPPLQTNLIIERGSPSSLLLQSNRTTVGKEQLTQLTMTFVLFQSRDGERGEKRGLVVDWEDGRTMLHLREKGGRRNPYQCSKDKREKKRKAGREGGGEREEEEGEVERGRERERERERERDFSSFVEYHL